MPKKAPEEPKPLSFATPNPWSALPREVHVGTGHGKKKGATTESPVDGQDQLFGLRHALRPPPPPVGPDPRLWGHILPLVLTPVIPLCSLLKAHTMGFDRGYC